MSILNISARPCQLLLGLALTSFSVAAEPQSDLTWRQSTPVTGSWKNHEQLVMENDRISVSILPGIGGRVICYVDRTTRVNHLYEGNSGSGDSAAGNPARIAGTASCEMRAEDARRKFILGPEFEEWGNSTHRTDVDLLPLRMSPKMRPGEIEKILGPYRRVVSPKEVTLVTQELRHNESYWVRIDAFESYVEPARLVARAADNTIEITSSNVRAFTLLLSHAPVEMNRAIRVIQNGRSVFEGKARTELSLGERAAGKGPCKTHGLTGPLSDVYYEPFLIVVPPAEVTDAAAARKEAEALRSQGLFGNRFFGVRIKSDHEITAEDIEQYYPIVFGSGSSSAFLNRIMGRLPVRIEGSAVVVGNRRFSGEDVGVQPPRESRIGEF